MALNQGLQANYREDVGPLVLGIAAAEALAELRVEGFPEAACYFT